MKYLVLLGDGMADDPVEKRENKTPLEIAQTPNMDRIADCGHLGMVRTVPENMEPGSDVANMAILGYEPDKYYTGRAAIEATFEGLLSTFPGLEYTDTTYFIEDDWVLVLWSGTCDIGAFPFATDTFLIRNGKIQRQTSVFEFVPKEAQ